MYPDLRCARAGPAHGRGMPGHNFLFRGPNWLKTERETSKNEENAYLEKLKFLLKFLKIFGGLAPNPHFINLIINYLFLSCNLKVVWPSLWTNTMSVKLHLDGPERAERTRPRSRTERTGPGRAGPCWAGRKCSARVHLWSLWIQIMEWMRQVWQSENKSFQYENWKSL